MGEESGWTEDRPRLQADRLVERLAPPVQHETRVALTGYLGPAATEGRWRLYASRAFDEYVEFEEADVVASETSEDSRSGGSTVWLKAGASVQHTKVSSRQVQASFLSGGTTRTFLPQADQTSFASTAGRADTGYGCTRNYVCSTNWHIPACQDRTEVCGSFGCPPTTGALCPSGEFTVC